jgi:hypothetical protein
MASSAMRIVVTREILGGFQIVNISSLVSICFIFLQYLFLTFPISKALFVLHLFAGLFRNKSRFYRRI